MELKGLKNEIDSMRHVIQSTFEDELQTGNQLLHVQFAQIAATQEMDMEESPDKMQNQDVDVLDNNDENDRQPGDVQDQQ